METWWHTPLQWVFLKTVLRSYCLPLSWQFHDQPSADLRLVKNLAIRKKKIYEKENNGVRTAQCFQLRYFKKKKHKCRDQCWCTWSLESLGNIPPLSQEPKKRKTPSLVTVEMFWKKNIGDLFPNFDFFFPVDVFSLSKIPTSKTPLSLTMAFLTPFKMFQPAWTTSTWATRVGLFNGKPTSWRCTSYWTWGYSSQLC